MSEMSNVDQKYFTEVKKLQNKVELQKRKANAENLLSALTDTTSNKHSKGFWVTILNLINKNLGL